MFPPAAERVMRPHDLGRIRGRAVGKGDQEGLVAKHMLEHPYEKVRMICRLTQALGRQPGRGKEPGQPFRIVGKECKRLNRQ